MHMTENSNMERTWCGLRKTRLFEFLEWRNVAAADMPDADTTVLMWVVTGNERDWCSGWWDGQDWRGCDHGGVVDGTVTHWAEPAGPAA